MSANEWVNALLHHLGFGSGTSIDSSRRFQWRLRRRRRHRRRHHWPKRDREHPTNPCCLLQWKTKPDHIHFIGRLLVLFLLLLLFLFSLCFALCIAHWNARDSAFYIFWFYFFSSSPYMLCLCCCCLLLVLLCYSMLCYVVFLPRSVLSASFCRWLGLRLHGTNIV